MISVLCPSRGRPDSLRESVESLRKYATQPDDLEVLVAIDRDDIAGYLDQMRDAQVIFWVSPERHGYTRLHEYYNYLAATLATGDWLLIWNDDARMLTPGWDQVIGAQPPGVLRMTVNHNDGGNSFPVFPAAWARALGYVSPHPHLDVWLGKIGDLLGCHNRIPVEVLHDRADVTGGHDDQTYAEGRALLGPYGMTGPLPDEQVRADAEIIRALGPGVEHKMKEGL